MARPDADLSAYRLTGESLRIPGVEENASGLTYSPESKTLFVIVDSPPSIVEFVPGGGEKRTVRLRGFADPEGITHVEGDIFAIVEEDRGRISVFEINEKTVVVKSKDTEKIKVDPGGGNDGLEGITYDPESKHFFVVKEKNPNKIYEVSRGGEVSNPWDAEEDSLGLSDLSDVYFDPATGHLVLLSHKSRAAVETTVSGEEISRLDFEMEKAEGITMEEAGTLYVCGEPNSLLSFSKRNDGPTTE